MAGQLKKCLIRIPLQPQYPGFYNGCVLCNVHLLQTIDSDSQVNNKRLRGDSFCESPWHCVECRGSGLQTFFGTILRSEDSQDTDRAF